MNKMYEPTPYLWDPAEAPDPEIVRMEELLKVYRMRPAEPPDFSQILATGQTSWMVIRSWRATVAMAAALVIVFGAIFFALRQRPVSWQVSAQGDVKIDGMPVGTTALRAGQWLVTGDRSQATVRVSDIGSVTLKDESAMSIIEDDRHKRLLLRYGVVHAKIVADPGAFVLETPFARATDLGCEFDLRLDRSGTGTLQVSAGWVGLEYMERQSLVPQGAEALIGGPGLITPPFFVDAGDGFKKALQSYSFSSTGRTDRADALKVLLRDARLRDSYTLINLFRISDRDERALIFERLNELVPAPTGVGREAVIAGDLKPLDAWWPVVLKKLGLTSIKKNTSLTLGRYRGET